MPLLVQEDWDTVSMDFHTSPNVNLKRRRDATSGIDREELLEEVQMKMNSPRHAHIHPSSHSHNSYTHTTHHDFERRHLVPRSKMSSNKRVRVGYSAVDGEFRSEQAKEKEKEKGAGGMDLRACHICRRKPTVKKELDAFANCEGCGKRTCWVCIRECLGGWGNKMGMRGEVEVNGNGNGNENKRIGEEGKENWEENGLRHRGMKLEDKHSVGQMFQGIPGYQEEKGMNPMGMIRR
ncbi:hypothetical protein SBOR_9739 [Sclerotinia borealis F-4128]|uniref:Uncharacterized protein n=1 Tax=Sclerotinia borealis (strain F-4128) TaxID=1432307 RepID=W9C5Q0_SCLBF|nr:hypothetical protein SBOR_9739 [Sclerotinia borealis F-4128]